MRLILIFGTFQSAVLSGATVGAEAHVAVQVDAELSGAAEAATEAARVETAMDCERATTPDVVAPLSASVEQREAVGEEVEASRVAMTTSEVSASSDVYLSALDTLGAAAGGVQEVSVQRNFTASNFSTRRCFSGRIPKKSKRTRVFVKDFFGKGEEVEGAALAVLLDEAAGIAVAEVALATLSGAAAAQVSRTTEQAYSVDRSDPWPSVIDIVFQAKASKKRNTPGPSEDSSKVSLRLISNTTRSMCLHTPNFIASFQEDRRRSTGEEDEDAGGACSSEEDEEDGCGTSCGWRGSASSSGERGGCSERPGGGGIRESLRERELSFIFCLCQDTGISSTSLRWAMF
uniref:Secreted protein n=1 Tax=Heterorhabditis bacteriophora TaxID=37862 RepID=A0A1I7WM88_HETBA